VGSTTIEGYCKKKIWAKAQRIIYYFDSSGFFIYYGLHGTARRLIFCPGAKKLVGMHTFRLQNRLFSQKHPPWRCVRVLRDPLSNNQAYQLTPNCLSNKNATILSSSYRRLTWECFGHCLCCLLPLLPRFDLQVALDDTYNIKKKPCGAYRTLGFRKNAMTVAGQLTGTATDPRLMTPEEQTAKLASALDEQSSNLVYPIRLLELKKVSIGERGRRSCFVLDAGAIFQDASGNISRLDFVVRMTLGPLDTQYLMMSIVASHSS
jgi:hypothetical protein